MYSTELKTEIQNKLLTRTGDTNKWIYRSSYVEKCGLGDLLKEIVKCTDHIKSGRLDERIYVILHNLTTVPRCCCGAEVKFKRFRLGYAEYCSVKCRANDIKWQKQVASTNISKYGVAYIAQLESERVVRSNTMTAKRPAMDMSKAVVKRRETIQRLYGVHYNSGWNEQAICTRIDNGNMVPVELLDDYREYYSAVVRVTSKQDISQLPHVAKRGVLGKDVDAHHIDHMVSVYDGFMNDVPAEVVGHICNLQCIPGASNIKKGNRSCMTIDQLYERYYEYA